MLAKVRTKYLKQYLNRLLAASLPGNTAFEKNRPGNHRYVSSLKIAVKIRLFLLSSLAFFEPGREL